MNTQAFNATRPLWTVRPGNVLPLGSAGGRLEVLLGRVWLTRAGDRDDHFVDSGQALDVPSGRSLIEAWGGAEPAVVAWRPASAWQRLVGAVRSVFVRCWDIVDPARRVGVGSLAAVVAVVAGALVFGPLSDARTRELAAPASLHNSGVGTRSRVTPDAESRGGIQADAAFGNSGRSRSAAQETRRRPAGPA